MNKRWVIASAEPALQETFARQLALPAPLAQVLINRGFRDVETARRFLNPQLRQLSDPFELPDMAAAVDRILAAIARQERVVIYGDYDVDGVTSSALLWRVLQAAGGTVANFLPHRMDEGYGLSADGIARCVKAHRPELLVAVDCGTSSRAEIAGLTKQGIDTIVLDHHEPPAELPECVLVNPKVVGRVTSRGAASGDAAYSYLASVGVSFKLAHALLKRERGLADKIDLRDYLDLVALGTVADIVPLIGENRILVKAGLERLPGTTKVGLRALLAVADVNEEVTPYHIGFRLGPRLNAAGRLADAMAALELLLTEDGARAAELANLLNDHNAERQRLEAGIVEQAVAMAREHESDRVFVLENPDWHMGVIGIVASRIVQQFYRPTVVIGQEGKGSCRSVAGFSIVAALGQCADLLERFGGHEMAAGLTVQAGKVEELRRQLNAQVGEILSPVLRIDAELQLHDLDAVFFAGLKQLEPCGQDNPLPAFVVWGVRLRGSPRVIGKKHLKLFVTDGETNVEAVWWNRADTVLPTGPLDIAFVPELNEFRGVESVQLNVRDVREAR